MDTIEAMIDIHYDFGLKHSANETAVIRYQIAKLYDEFRQYMKSVCAPDAVLPKMKSYERVIVGEEADAIIKKIQDVWGYVNKAYDGFCFDLAVKFLWSTSEDVSYDYTVGDSSVYGQEDPQPTLGAILYNGAKLEDELAYLMQEADRRIDVYESLYDYQAFLERLQNRRDFVSIANRDFDKRDKAKAVALVLCGRASEAQEIFVNNSPYDSVSERFANSCLNYEDFERELLDVVNDLRRRLSTKMKIKLEDIERI